MQQVKLFKGIESEAGALEKEINAWIVESGARVVQVTGNIAPQTMKPDSTGPSGRMYVPSDLFVTVLYETT